MASQSDFSFAMANRSLRTIRSELEFLTDSAILTPQQYSSIISQLPSQDDVRSVSQPTPAQPPQPSPQPAMAPVQSPPAHITPAQSPPGPYSPPTGQFAKASLNEKDHIHNPYNPYSSPPPPPAYTQGPPVLSIATALYAYTPTDAGDLALQMHDRIQVLEHMNNDWWRGRNERTGLEGIFPRSYVNVIDEKSGPPPSSYGNMPLEVSQSGSDPATEVGPDGKTHGKFNQHGKKFGKKMGNAAIFGAGATIGSNIVNSVF